MKKKTFKLLTAALFLGALVVTFSTASNNQVSLVNKSHAFDPDRRTYTLVCSNGSTITVCAVGSNTCIPVGQCGPQG